MYLPTAVLENADKLAAYKEIFPTGAEINFVAINKVYTKAIREASGIEQGTGSYVIPHGYTSIGTPNDTRETGVFKDFQKEAWQIPASVSYIGNYAFYEANFGNIIINCDIPPELGENVFPASIKGDSNKQLIVPSEAISKYKSNPSWLKYFNEDQIK